MEKIRITSDGTEAGTTVFVGDTEIGGIASIEIGDILPHGVVSAKLEFMAVELDIKADPVEGMMTVIIDGKEDLRPIASRDVIILSDGTESGANRPLVYDGEQAVYYLDGQPPRIIKTLKG